MNLPERIWLQWHGDEKPNEDGTFDFADIEPGDVSWCCERVFEGDSMYIRADLVDAKDAEIGRLNVMVGNAYYAGATNAQKAFEEFGTFSDCSEFHAWKSAYLKEKGQ